MLEDAIRRECDLTKQHMHMLTFALPPLDRESREQHRLQQNCLHISKEGAPGCPAVYLQGAEVLITEASSAGQICVVKAHGELPTYKLWTELWYEKSMVPVAGMLIACTKIPESANRTILNE